MGLGKALCRASTEGTDRGQGACGVTLRGSQRRAAPEEGGGDRLPAAGRLPWWVYPATAGSAGSSWYSSFGEFVEDQESGHVNEN